MKKRNKYIHRVAILLIILVCSTKSYSQQSEIRMQSVFLYNFTRLISWPADYQSGNFVIAVYGRTVMYDEIEDMATTKKAGSQQIEAKQFNSINDITKCHILYVPSNQSRNIESIVNNLKSRNIKALVVGNSRSAIRSGAVINFTIVDGRQRFELSQSNAKALGITLGGEITRLAILVD